MSTEKNKASVRRLNEATNKGDVSRMPEFFAPNFVSHTTPEMKGPEGMKQSHISMRTAFPDYNEKIEHMAAEGDLVAVFYTLTGTFSGKYGNAAPTGKKISITMAVLSRFENGKQVESWLYYDSLAWYQQMGIPIPAQ